MRDISEDGIARAEARLQAARQAEKRRADTLAEYAAVGDQRRAKSSELRTLRILKEARDRAAAKAEAAAAENNTAPPKAKRTRKSA